MSQISSGPAVARVSPATRGSSGELNCQIVGLMMNEQLHLQVPVKDVMDAGVKKIVDSYDWCQRGIYTSTTIC